MLLTGPITNSNVRLASPDCGEGMAPEAIGCGLGVGGRDAVERLSEGPVESAAWDIEEAGDWLGGASSSQVGVVYKGGRRPAWPKTT